MTSLPFPDSGSRQALYANGDQAANVVATVCADRALTILAEIYADNAGAPGARITNAQLLLDAYGRQPDWWGPADGTSRLWVTVNGGPAAPVDADYGRRIDTLAAQVWETPSDAQARADAAQAAASGVGAALAIVFGG